MANTELISREDVVAQWNRYVQSTVQLAWTRFSRFPPNSGPSLAESLGIKPGERILEIGSGLGIFSSRLNNSNIPVTIVGIEPNEAYLDYELPDCLQATNRVSEVCGDGFTLPFTADSFDRVIAHAVVTLFPEREWQNLPEEVKRILDKDGCVSHLDNINNESWYPEYLRLTGTDRRTQFESLLEETHENLQTGYAQDAHDLTEQLENVGFNPTTVDTYSKVLRLSESRWEDRQVRELLTLRHRAELDRLSRFTNLLEALNRNKPDTMELLDRCREDFDQLHERRLRAFQDDRELGWDSCTTLVVTGEFSP
ncbi:MAG: class I SAM-dependent methyltransferase [bacterium]